MSKTGVMIIGGSGAIGSALIAGLELYKKNIIDGQYLGCLTYDPPFAGLGLCHPKDMVIGAWDLRPSNPFETCLSNKVFHKFNLLKNIENLAPVKIYDGILTPSDYLISEGILSRPVENYEDAVVRVKENIRNFKDSEGVDDVVIVNIASPHKNIEISTWHDQLESFQKKIKENDPNITSSMLYCYAGITEGCPFIEFTPSSTLEAKALIELALNNNVPLAGRDGSTGQTLLKYVLSPMFKSRNLKVEAWYSTNILGNNDGKVLSNPDYAKSKMHDKSHGVKQNLGYDIDQIIDIKYLPQKKDNKESWDLIEFTGWMGEEMSVRINWNGKDSVLASPLIFDLVRLMKYAKEKKRYGIQDQLGVYFKNPMGSTTRDFFELNHQFINYYQNESNNLG